MRATIGQRFWRWTVTIAFVVAIVGGVEVNRAYRTINEPGHIADAVIGVEWGFAANVAHFVFLIALPMLVIVELLAWRRRHAWRRARLRQAQTRTSEETFHEQMNRWYRA
jgi:hypothetical protein